MLIIWICCVDSGDSESTDLMSLNNKTFNDESTPLTTPGLSIDKEGAKLDSDVGNGPTLFTDKMVSGNSVAFKDSIIGSSFY